jgi:hypothetical protein
MATFVLQRLIDVGAEPLIALIEGDRIFVTALATNGLLAALLAGVCSLANIRGLDPVLLAAMVTTSTVLLSLHRNRMQGALISYLASFLTLFMGLTAWAWWHPEALSLRGVLLATNAGSALLGLALLLRAGRIDADAHAIAQGIRSGLALMPRAIASSLVTNVLTTAYLLVCSYLLPARDLGALRVGTSIVQAASSLYPANMKAIFVSMGESGADDRLRRVLVASFWLFLAMASVVTIASALRSEPLPGAALAFVATPFFWAMCLERYVQMAGPAPQLRRLNIAVAPAMLAAAFACVQTLDDALRLYSLAVGVWCALLAVLARPAALVPTVLVVAAASVAAFAAAQYRADFGLLATAALLVIGILMLRPDRSTLNMLTGRL